jgi:phosphatidylglycerol:prolipoprotein diacylglycerol transferase
MHPKLIDFGSVHLFGRDIPIAIQSFGLMVVAAYFAAGWLVVRELRRRQIQPAHIEGYPLAALLGGIVGARVYYLFEHPSSLRADFLGALFDGAGLTWYGGVLGGIAATGWLAYRRRQNFWALADAFAPGLALAYAIGRIGCQLAGDGDYGPPSDLPWAMAYPNGVVPTLERCHPTPVYETLMMGAATWLLLRLRRATRPAGWLFGVYLVLAGAERWLAEWFRVRPERLGGLSTAQWLSLVVLCLGLLLLARRRRER